MSFWTGYWYGRMSPKHNDGGSGEGMAILFGLGLLLVALHSMLWGMYNLADSVPRLVAYYAGEIDVHHYKFLTCKEPSSIWRSDSISECFYYTKSFYWNTVLIKSVFLLFWLMLLSWSLAGSRVAFWSVSLLSCLAIVTVWAVCGDVSCSAHLIARLKDWPYWPESRAQRYDFIWERILYSLLGVGSFLLTLILMRIGIGRGRIRLFNKRVYDWWFLRGLLGFILGAIAIFAGLLMFGVISMMIYRHNTVEAIDLTEAACAIAVLLPITLLTGFSCRILIRQARSKRRLVADT